VRISRTVRDVFRRIQLAYQNGARRPLGGYVAVAGTYAATLAALAAAGRARHVRLPPRLDLLDIVLLTVASHKASRLIS
jgi:hypothetical protein